MNLSSEGLKLPLGTNPFQACYQEQNLPPLKAKNSPHILTRQMVPLPFSTIRPISERSVHLWMRLFHNTGNKKEPYTSLCSPQEPHHSSVTAADSCASILHSRSVLGTCSDKPKAPAASPASAQDPCAVFERVPVHPCMQALKCACTFTVVQ